MQKKKKGFTLVELLVVIAILAILADVSVVGYLSFTEKAKESNDSVLVTQLNTVLQADEASDGKPNTMSEALDVLKENGFLVENLTPTSAKNEFLYNLKSNRFEIKSKEELNSLNNGDYWYIVEDEATIEELKDNCSLYLIDNLTLTNTEVLDIKYGFDSLNNNISKLTITNNEGPSDIVLNTNIKNIEVNAADDNVSHYGTADNVIVTAVADNSYHEYGVVNRVEVASGHVEFMDNSKVMEVYITGSTVKLTISSSVIEYESIDIVLANGITLPNDAINKPIGSKDVIEEKVVSTFAELSSYFNNKYKDGKYNYAKDSYVKLNNDIVFTDYIQRTLRAKGKITRRLNLNNHKLVLSNNMYIKLFKYDNVIIENGTLDFNTSTSGLRFNATYTPDETPTLTLNNVIFSNVASPQHASNFYAISTGYQSNIILNNCTYENYGAEIIEPCETTNVTINGGRYEMLTRNFSLLENKGNLVVNGGNFKGNCDDSNTAVIKNSGSLVVNDGEFISPKGATIFNQGHATLNGGRFISKSCSKCNQNAATGSTHYVYSVYSGGNPNTFITINDGTYIEGIHGGLAVTSGGAEINGGKIVTVECPSHKTTSHYALYLAGEVADTNIIINGGEFTSFDKVAMYVGNSKDGGNLEKARVTVKGGTFNGGGDKTAIKVDSKLGYLTVLGGKYSSDISKVTNLNVKTEQQGNYWVVA